MRFSPTVCLCCNFGFMCGWVVIWQPVGNLKIHTIHTWLCLRTSSRLRCLRHVTIAHLLHTIGRAKALNLCKVSRLVGFRSFAFRRALSLKTFRSCQRESSWNVQLCHDWRFIARFDIKSSSSTAPGRWVFEPCTRETQKSSKLQRGTCHVLCSLAATHIM